MGSTDQAWFFVRSLEFGVRKEPVLESMDVQAKINCALVKSDQSLWLRYLHHENTPI